MKMPKGIIDPHWEEHERTYFVGEAWEIKALYRAIAKHGYNIMPKYGTFPKFNMEKCYALCLESVPGSGIVFASVVNGDTMLHLILDNEIVSGFGIR